MTTGPVVREGGCFCGAVRYRVTGEPQSTTWCHCRMCQRASGAPAVAWGTFSPEAFAFVSGTPTVFQSSPRGERTFCPACGTPLSFRPTGGRRDVDITLASLDDPSSLAPDHHIWRSSRIPWFDTTDTLPRYDAETPPSQD
jgi:hypothetical protein